MRPDLMAFAIQVADAPITFLLRRRLFAISDPVAGFPFGASDLPGPVAKPRKADLSVQRHARFLLARNARSIRPQNGKGDSPIAPMRRPQLLQGSRGSERTGRRAGDRTRAGKHQG